MKYLKKTVAVWLLGLIPLLSSAQEQKPSVVVSIKPIHSLVAGVMTGVADPELLLPGGASPHDYSLRPSDVRLIEGALAVFWVGDSIESFLVKPLANAAEVRNIALQNAPEVNLLPLREGGAWEAHAHDHGEKTSDHDDHDDHDHEEAHDHHGEKISDHDGHDHEEAHNHDHGEHGHDKGDWDAHIWLDPQNAMAMVRHISSTLSDLDPSNQAKYAANADNLLARLAALDEELQAQLAPVKDQSYFVFHDAYQYFEQRYDLAAAGSLTVSPEQKPGARRVREIRDRIREQQVLCVFSEPQYEAALVDTLIEDTSAKRGVLDPLGAELQAGSEAYFELMNNLAEALTACLGQA